MKISFYIGLALVYYSSFAQSSVQTSGSLCTEPICLSLRIVLQNTEHANFLLVNPNITEKQDCGLPDTIALANSLADIQNSAFKKGQMWYICVSDYKMDSLIAMIEWRLMTATPIHNDIEMNCHYYIIRKFPFIYRYDGTSWLPDPSNIQSKNDRRLKTLK
jgi:hypothetical protein